MSGTTGIWLQAVREATRVPTHPRRMDLRLRPFVDAVRVFIEVFSLL
jgi:hypothetical protein